MKWAVLIFAFVCGIALTNPAKAEDADHGKCDENWPEPPATGVLPQVLRDPTTGLTLYLESDGRHMAAIAHDGSILWHRNLFDDPKIERYFMPPGPLPGEAPSSLKDWQRSMHAYVESLGIDRLEIVPDCARASIDHSLPTQFRGHYIRAGSGTHIFWLLDARTGDFQLEAIN
ncbi:MAG: hypothetical protein JSR60_11375 [Proteobacteria bacterium]|nr:hypothetical protein [Pseudomonadota bacterium]